MPRRLLKRLKRPEKNQSYFQWFWVNFGPFVSMALAFGALLDTAHATRWAAAATIIAGFTGGKYIHPIFNGGIEPPPNPQKEEPPSTKTPAKPPTRRGSS